MSTSDKYENAIHEIQREVRKAETLSICYILYRVDTEKATYYAIEIILDGEWNMQMLGVHEMRALRLFEILVNELVTPCTLSEVLHDLSCDEDERLHLQNLCKM